MIKKKLNLKKKHMNSSQSINYDASQARH
jgi:hypothetical protein